MSQVGQQTDCTGDNSLGEIAFHRKSHCIDLSLVIVISENHYLPELSFKFKGDLILQLDLKWNKDLIQKESSELLTTK